MDFTGEEAARENTAAATRSVGLTGNIGSGKSAAARLLAQRGAAIIDSDVLAHEATEEPEVLARIRHELGSDLVANGSLDRKRTAELVFSDEAARRRLEGIVHPWVRGRSRTIQQRLLASREPPALIVHELPLLYELGLEGEFDAVVVVVAPAEVRAARAAARSGLSREEFLARDRVQLPLAEKAARADYVLDNGGGREALAEQVEALWSRLITS